MKLNEDCAVCGSNGYDILFKKQQGDYNYDIVKCMSCGLVMVYPKLSHDKIVNYYNQPNHMLGDDTIPEKDLKRTTRRIARIKSWCGEMVLCARKYPLENSTPFKKGMGYILKHFMLKGLPDFYGEGKILDVGCNNGLYLYFLKHAGWDVYGLDINVRACEAARSLGIKVFAGALVDAHYPDHFFDVVRLNHVIEHVESPLGYMEEVKRILKPGGIVYVAFPNQCSFNFYFFKQFFQGPHGHHLYAFSKNTFETFCKKFGFRMVDARIKSNPGAMTVCMAAWSSYQQGFMKTFIKRLADLALFKFFFVKPFCFFLNIFGYGDIFEAKLVLNKMN